MTQRIGRYELIRPIASGGMATVHLGRVIGAGGFQRVVAIKVMHAHIASDPDFVAMFLDEARLAAGIRHPNVVATLDIDQTADGLLLVMEYVDGLAVSALLKSLRKRGAPAPVPFTLRVLLDTLAGLHAAHELLGPDARPLGLVHRDVSPQNVLVGADGIARLTDFGVARAEARISSTRGSQVKGKVPYMSPEQLQAEVVDRRSDVWAAGAVLWEMLTGRRLFHAANDGALVAAVMRGATENPRALRPEVPEAIDRVIMRALAPLESRWSTAAEFADALEHAAEQSGVPIATPRAVGKAVIEEMAVLGKAPLPATVAGAGSVPPELRSSPLASPAPVVPEADDQAPTIAREVSESTPSQAAALPVEALPIAGSGASAIASVLSPRKRSRARGVGAALAALLVAGGATAAFVVVRHRAAEPAAPASTPASAPTPTVIEALATAPSSEPSAAPVASAQPSPAADAATPAAPRPQARPPARPRKPKGGEFQPGRL